MASIQTPSQVVDGSPIPMPGIYKEQQALAQKAYATSLANINQRRQAMLQQYGMTGTVDAQGAYSNYRIDPANQYGQLQMMKQNQGLQLNDAWNQAAERNLGNSGLAAQGESLLRYSQGGESAQLGQEFVSGMGDLAQENVQNQDVLAQANYQAEAQARNEAIQNQMFTQANSGSLGGSGSGGSGGLQYNSGGQEALSKAGYSDEQILAAIAAAGWHGYTGPSGPEAPQVMQNGQRYDSSGNVDSNGQYLMIKVGGGPANYAASTELIYVGLPAAQTTQTQQQPISTDTPVTPPTTTPPKTNPTQRAQLAAAISGILRTGGMS